MTDQQLIDQFESGTIQPELFHHADHVRLAFAYLSRNPPLQALEKFTGALRKYAAAHGKPNLYHETITHAYFFLIRERIVRTEVFQLGRIRASKRRSSAVERWHPEALLP